MNHSFTRLKVDRAPEPEPLQQLHRTYVRYRGRKYSYFSGCDYFRLASHPEVRQALVQGLKRYGLNVAASRLTTGNHKLYGEFEELLTRFFQAEAALVVATGYLTNLVVCQALAGSFSHALIDEKSHPALVDAAKFLECPVITFKSRDPQSLSCGIERCGPLAKLVLLTDGLFARDGAVAPLADYLAVLPRDALVLVDDAHGAGTIGKHGRGSLEHLGVSCPRIIVTVTFSKAFGAYGGGIIGGDWLRNRILQRSRLFAGSTPLPLPLVCAAMKGIQLVQRDHSLRKRLEDHTRYTRNGLQRAGLPVSTNPGPIVALYPCRRGAGARVKASLLRSGVLPPLINNYPGGPAGGFYRFVISSEHTLPQLNRLIEVVGGNSDDLVATGPRGDPNASLPLGGL